MPLILGHGVCCSLCLSYVWWQCVMLPMCFHLTTSHLAMLCCWPVVTSKSSLFIIISEETYRLKMTYLSISRSVKVKHFLTALWPYVCCSFLCRRPRAGSECKHYWVLWMVGHISLIFCCYIWWQWHMCVNNLPAVVNFYLAEDRLGVKPAS